MEETTAKRLRDLRINKKVSQSEVAKYLGIERASYTAYEAGKSRPVRYMDKLAQYFNVSVDYLLCLSDTPQPKKQGLNDTEIYIIDSYWKLNDKGKEMLLANIDFLLSKNQFTEKETHISA